MFLFETRVNKIRIASTSMNEFIGKEKICILKHCRLIKILLMDN